MIKRIIKIVLGLVIAFGFYVGFWLVYGTINDWHPEPLANVEPISFAFDTNNGSDSLFSLITWNLGFGGLGAESSFFFDGGETVILEKSLFDKNMTGIVDFVRSQQDIDLFLMQEVDTLAKRSHGLNQVNEITKALPDHGAIFASNFNVNYIPIPFTSPLGECRSGLATFSSHPLYFSERHNFSTEYKWPNRIFYLDRCFMTTHIPLLSGRDLVVVNTHCSAYDKSGEMVAQQLKEIIAFATAEYKRGNYVVIGGDWNQCPPNYTPKDLTLDYGEVVLTDGQLPQGWRWVADPTIATNRKNQFAYKKGETYTSVIDHFVVSPNLEVVDIHGIDLDFQFSDHQPVHLTVKLN